MLTVDIGTECQDCITMISRVAFKKFHEGHAPTQVRTHKSERPYQAGNRLLLKSSL